MPKIPPHALGHRGNSSATVYTMVLTISQSSQTSAVGR